MNILPTEIWKYIFSCELSLLECYRICNTCQLFKNIVKTMDIYYELSPFRKLVFNLLPYPKLELLHNNGLSINKFLTEKELLIIYNNHTQNIWDEGNNYCKETSENNIVKAIGE